MGSPSALPTNGPTELAERIAEVETESKGVSTELFVVAIFVCVFLGAGIGFVIRSLSSKSNKENDVDLENGAKRLPGTNPLPVMKEEISLQSVVDAPSWSLGGNTTELGEGKDSLQL